MSVGDKIIVHGHCATVVSVHGGGKKLAVTIDATQQKRFVKSIDAKEIS